MRKILTLFLCLLILVSCTGKKVDPNNGNNPTDGSCIASGEINISINEDKAIEYLNKIKNFKVRVKDKSKTENNQEFEEFLDQVFVDSVEDSYLGMHQQVVDYEALGLTKPEPKWDVIDFDKVESEELEEELNKLLSFDYDSLSYRQQYDYDIFEYSLYESLAHINFNQFTFLYSSNTDFIGNVMTSLSDFVFQNKDEVDDYLILLSDTDRYLNDGITFTKKQIEAGLLMTDSTVDYSNEAIDRILSTGDDANVLITSFNSRIDALDYLTDEEKQDYKNRNKEIVINEIIPVLKDTNEFILSQKGSVCDSNIYTLHNLSPNYAELVYLLQGSNNENLDKTYDNLSVAFDDLLLKYIRGYLDEESNKQYEDIANNNPGIFELEAEEMLDYLAANLNKYYPELGNVDYDLDYIDASSASNTVLAYYWPAPLDRLDQNIIRVNPNNLQDDPIEAYTTLAHEGFPGHLYQHVFFQKTNPNKFRNVQRFIGYTEGYAVQAQSDALYFGDIYENATDSLRDILNFDSIFYFLYFSKLDIGINYYGWDLNKLSEVLEEDGLYGADAASYFMDLLIDMPGVYCSYGLGYVNFMNLREYAKQELGDKFDIVEYNEAILKHGEMPFTILKYAVDEYIDETK